MKLIGQGAEAKVYKKENIILKDRVKKSYRIKEIDDKLRQFRTRRESKILEKLEKLNFPAPRLIKTNREDKIEMELIKGKKLRDVLEKIDYKKISKEIGKKLAFLHNNEIIHQDLTTSNLILKDEIYFIDFGLSFFSKRLEDKAMDLHLFRQALESKHHLIYKSCFNSFLSSYKKNVSDSKDVLIRLEKVESRGRNKLKG